MEVGVTIFATDRTVAPAAFARAAEERGYSSIYLPEHTHLPVESAGPGGASLGEPYRRTLDPWVALAAAGSVTNTLTLGTGVCLVAEHDPIVLAKTIGTLDCLTAGRVVLGVGYGWNRFEALHHGVPWERRRACVREHVLAMQAIWNDDVAEFDGEFVKFGPSYSWPKSEGGRPIRTLLGGAAGPGLFAHIAEFADGWMPFGGAGVARALPALREAFEACGRDPETAEVVPFGTVPDQGKLEYYESLGVREVVLRIPAGAESETFGALDEYAEYL